jgi:two-component system, NtrC family, response regulator AtoC
MVLRGLCAVRSGQRSAFEARYEYPLTDGPSGPPAPSSVSEWACSQKGGDLARRSILVVDDEESFRQYLATLLSASGYDVVHADSGEQALRRLESGPLPAVIMLDLVMPGMGGLALLDRVRAAHPSLSVIVMSTIAQLKTVVDAVRRGASDYLTKPFEQAELELAIQNALEKQALQEQVTVLGRQLGHDLQPEGIISADPAMLRLKEMARQVADTDAPVLITGESGVGKEVVARFIHRVSRRRVHPFVKVNCAALPSDLLESEVFGYDAGAFSGAIREKPGKFELAHKGSILLDEIGEMSANLQAKLLHVLQDGEYTRLGGRKPIRVDSRVLATTNLVLEEAVASGRFREDLYFRLNVIRLEIPPLRDHIEDVPLLGEHFLGVYAARYGKEAQALPAELIQRFMSQRWPGNVRELENTIRRYVILPDFAAEPERPAAVPAGVPEPPDAAPGGKVPPDLPAASLRDISARAADAAERQVVERVLQETRWNRKEAARRLNISYKALLNRLKRWQVEP